ncbi:putative nuclease HARBI1 [Dermacentor silvarum]|uniref:putative nuclease HARBI1 n=1 Tax=Dermacentor silvarum TaxID=543639 RepID=UPI0018971376|nr:putative nuclease HARBI1 [Dermacentor silvarum]
MSRKGDYAENCMFICDADMSILSVYPMRPGSDHDSFVWRTTWLRRRFPAGRIANPGVCLISNSCYLLDPWLLTLVPGHPPMQTAEGKYNTAHATLRSVVERRIGLLMSRFRCLQRYLHPPLRARTCGQHCRRMCCVAHTTFGCLRVTKTTMMKVMTTAAPAVVASSITMATPYHTVCPETGGLN